MSIKIFLLLIICTTQLTTQDNFNIRYVYKLMRHGARAPYESTDVLDTKWVPEMILDVGRRQHYLAGLRDREKYKGYISSVYKPEEVYFISTQYYRTNESVQSRFLGLYNENLGEGPKVKPILEEKEYEKFLMSIDFNNQSTEIKGSIREVFGKEDAIRKNFQVGIFHQSKRVDMDLESDLECPYLNSYFNSDVFINKKIELGNYIYKKQNRVFKDILKIDSNPTTVKSFTKLDKACDQIFSNTSNDLPLAKLKEAGMTDKEIVDLRRDCLFFNKRKWLELWYSPIDNYSLAIVKSRSKVIEVIQDIDRRIKYDNDGMKDKYLEYSLPKLKYIGGHDTTVSNLLTVIGITFNIDINKLIEKTDFFDYTCELEVVLSQNSNSEYRVDVTFSNDIPIISSMDYNLFKLKLEDKVISYMTEEEYCFREKENKVNSILKGFFLGLCILIFFLLIMLMMKRLYPNLNLSASSRKDSTENTLQTIKNSHGGNDMNNTATFSN